MWRSNNSFCALLGLIALASATAFADQPDGEPVARALPEGPGLAAKYPGDRGLADEPRVVFVESFEQESLEAVQERWESVSAAERMELTDDTPAASAGRRSLRMTHIGGEGEGGHLYRRLLPGYDQLYVRFYVKFDPECAPVHHFFHVGGYRPPTPYPQGGAGERPRGDERFSVGIEPHGSAWVWDYYAYWMRMRGSPPRGQTWGNSFIRDPQHKVARGAWICMETMIKLNDPDESNGELALWIDGKRVSHIGPGFPSGKWVYDKFLPGEGGDGVRWNDQRRGPEYTSVPVGGEPFEGFRWRSDERLKINFLWVLFYMTRAPEGHASRVWFDDIVVATEYIGPLAVEAGREGARGDGPGEQAGDSAAEESRGDEAEGEERSTVVKERGQAADEPAGKTVRIGAAQPRSRLIDYRKRDPADVLAEVDRSLEALERIVHRAGEAGCDVLCLPEDTLGLGHWEAGNPSALGEVLPAAVEKMLDRLGRASASHRMYLVCSNDTVDAAGAVRNTAFLLGRDGLEIGRYDKVNMPIHELHKTRGESFPVFRTPDLGDVGMLICYDMVFPEAARCLALGGADIIFNPTLGGAAIGDRELSRAAFRTRAAENFVYLVVASRGSGSMIVSPQGQVLAEGQEADGIAIADVDIGDGRAGGDAFNHQQDMRARLFRERSPAAFGILTDPNPPVLRKAPETISIPEASRIANAALTVGTEEFQEAEMLLRDGRRREAVQAFEALSARYPATWIDRVARERLERVDRSSGQ